MNDNGTTYGLYKLSGASGAEGYRKPNGEIGDEPIETAKLILEDGDQSLLETYRDRNAAAALAAGRNLTEERWAVRPL